MKKKEIENIFGKNADVRFDRYAGKIVSVAGFKSDDVIDHSILRGNSRYIKTIYNFLEHNDYDTRKFLLTKKRNSWRTKNKAPLSYESLPRLVHGDVWEWGIENIPRLQQINADKPNNLFSKHIVITDLLHNNAKKKGLVKEFKTFIAGLPNIKTVAEKMNPFFRNLDGHRANRFFHYLQRYHSPEEVDFKELFKDPFIMEVFNLEPKEVGKGEILFVLLFKNTKMMGGSEPYDIIIDNKRCQLILELKAQNDEVFRLGKAKIPFFGFYKHFDEVFKNVNILLDNIDVKDLCDEKLVTPQLDGVLKLVTTLQDNWVDGEFPYGQMNDFRALCYMLHSHIRSNCQEKCFISYPNESQGTSLAELDKKNMSVNVNYKEDEAFAFLKTLRYIDDPNKIDEDLDNAPLEYFEHNKKIDFILLFQTENAGKVESYLTPSDLSFGRITQGGVKFKKKDDTKKNTTVVTEAWKKFSGKVDESYEYYYLKELNI